MGGKFLETFHVWKRKYLVHIDIASLAGYQILVGNLPPTLSFESINNCLLTTSAINEKAESFVIHHPLYVILFSPFLELVGFSHCLLVFFKFHILIWTYVYPFCHVLLIWALVFLSCGNFSWTIPWIMTFHLFSLFRTYIWMLDLFGSLKFPYFPSDCQCCISLFSSWEISLSNIF